MSRLVEAVLLDLNNVAEDYPSFAIGLDAVVGRVAAKIAGRFGGSAATIRELVAAYAKDTGTPYLPHYPAVWRFVAESQAGRVVTEREAADVYGWYLDEYRSGIEIHGDFVPFLEQCRREGLRTGIVANGNAQRIGVFIEKFGIAEYVTTVVASGATPFQKPAPEIFRMALRNIGLAAHRVAFVGDRLDTDVLGSNGVGMWSVRLLRGPAMAARAIRPEEAPDETVTSLAGLWSTRLLRPRGLVDTAVIMAGGRGSRMKELTAQRQKCLLPAGDEPILATVVESLRHAGVGDFHFVVGYRADDVEAFIKRRFPNLKASFHVAASSETASGVATLLNRLPRQFVYSHGNIAVPSEVISRLMKMAYSQPARTWFAATARDDIAPTHPVFLAKNGNVAAVCRRVDPREGKGWMYSIGIGVVSQESVPVNVVGECTTEQLWEGHPGGIGLIEFDGEWWHLESAIDLENFVAARSITYA